MREENERRMLNGKMTDTEIQSKYRSSNIIEKHPFGKFYIKDTNVATRKIVQGPVNGYKIH